MQRIRFQTIRELAIPALLEIGRIVDTALAKPRKKGKKSK
jgi:hypothetical protein